MLSQYHSIVQGEKITGAIEIAHQNQLCAGRGTTKQRSMIIMTLMTNGMGS
jgi:hypothetical protein